MARNPMRHSQSLYYHYHQDQRHITQDCRNLWNHLDQLVRERKLNQLLHQSSGQGSQAGSEPQRDASLRPPLETINVIFAVPGRTGSCLSRVMFVSRLPAEGTNSRPKRAKMDIRPILSFSDKEKIRTIQSHNDALVITLRIRRYDMKRVMVDQGCTTKICTLSYTRG